MYFLLQTGTQDTFLMLATNILPFAAIMGIMYFVLIRPQKARDKKLQDMRGSLEIGDSVTTVGGIIGRVITIKEDTVVIETGTDRSKLRLKRWAISDVEKLAIE